MSATADNFYTQGFFNANVRNMLTAEEGAGQATDPIALNIPDDDLVEIIDKRITASRKFYEDNYDLYSRREKNETYLFGRQVAEMEKEGKLKDYSAKNLDNVIYEIERTIKPLAMSQLPDLIVTPGQNTDFSKQTALLLTQGVNSDVRKRDNRKVLAMAFKHRSVYFVGVIKCRWNPELEGGLGDYEFMTIHPDLIDMDESATEADAEKMKWISQIVHSTVEEVTMMFPDSKNKFYDELKRQGVMSKEAGREWESMATPIDYREVWFTDYEKAEDGKWQRTEGVCWKYEDCILGKMKNPYFDYEGEKQLFTYENPQLKSTRRPLRETEMYQSMITGEFPEHVEKEQVYHNYFKAPKKPFFFVVYDQWGKQPLDETTHLEQNIRNQDTLDTRQKQIEETLNHRGHHIWSKLGGFKPSDVQKMDHNNPSQDYLVEGRPQDVHDFVQPERPTQQEFNDLDRIHQRMYAVSGSQAIRGEVQAKTAATNNQIAREGNYTVADDIVEDTINPASEWMAQWALHMIKTRYTQEHFRKLLGKKGEVLFLTLHQNMIEDGMVVMIKASGTDKIRKQNNAMEMARMDLIDPLSFYEDMDLDDPEGRAAKIITFKTAMPLYVAEFVESGPTATTELAGKLAAITAQQQQAANPPLQAQPPQAPGTQLPSPQNTGQVPVLPSGQPPQESPRNL